MNTARKNKRKLKAGLKKVLFIAGIICTIFTIAFGGLYGWWFYQQKTYAVVSPVPTSLPQKMVNKQVHKTPSAKQLTELLEKNRIAYTTIDAETDGSFVVTLEEKQKVFISTKKALQIQVSSLQLILTRLTIEDRKFTRLDLRFDKPIIVF